MPPSKSFPPEFVDRVSAATHKSLVQIVEAIGVKKTAYEISREKVLEVAQYFLKDLRRLAIPQENEIADTKYAAYWAFWVRKIKPVRVAWLDDAKQDEITDINERAALELAIATVKHAGKHPACLIRGACLITCDGSRCVEQYTSDYFTVNENYYSEYIVYSMGKRTFGPHHLCAVLDSILFAACRQPAGKLRPALNPISHLNAQ
jgi:hypothetical protein